MRFVKFFGTRQDQINRLREQGWRFATITTAPVVVGWHHERGKVSAKAWQFKADKPSWHYLFPNDLAARDYINRYVVGVKNNADYRAKRDADRKAARCDGVDAVYAKAAREGYITAAETAVCLRVELARTFPGIKFSVRSDTCIRVGWTDGPTAKEVERVANSYSGEGFDGSIDLRHSIQRWLSRDGSMSLAHDSGTQGSGGYHAEAIGSAHAPDAVLVRLGADFVFCNRSLSDEVKRDLCRHVCVRYGVIMPEMATRDDLERFINTTHTGRRIPQPADSSCGQWCLGDRSMTSAQNVGDLKRGDRILLQNPYSPLRFMNRSVMIRIGGQRVVRFRCCWHQIIRSEVQRGSGLRYWIIQ